MIYIFWHTDLTDLTDSVSNDVSCGGYIGYLGGLNRLFTMAIYGTYKWQRGNWASSFYN